jgi:predicted nuclease of restriction endonuclease-like RecB superfamily
MALGRAGMNDGQINNLYRTLYVNSVGFFAKLDDYTRNLIEEAQKIKIRIWVVFNALL